MIDERHEELASLYVFDLLEGSERAEFEAALAREPELQALVRDLRETSVALAHGSATQPPAALRTRVLASVSPAKVETLPDNVIRPSAAGWTFVPWAIAACLAFGAAWLGQRYLSSTSEVAALRQNKEMLEITVESARQQIEADRIITRRQLQDAEQQLAAASTQLGDTRTQLADRDRLLADARTQLADRGRELADETRRLSELSGQLANREQEVATLTRRFEALTAAAANADRQLGESRQQIARLIEEMKSRSDLADLKIAALASMLKGSPQAQAIAVWDPKKQEGILDVQNLPALAVNQDYQLWIVDPQYPNPVDGGVFTVDATSGRARVDFRTKQPIKAVNAFAVTRERKGGVPKAEGPFVLMGK